MRPPVIDIRWGDKVRFWYTNWKGRRALRTCIFQCVSVGDKHHGDAAYEPELRLSGHDLDKNARRSYHYDGIELDTVEVMSGNS